MLTQGDAWRVVGAPAADLEVGIVLTVEAGEADNLLSLYSVSLEFSVQAAKSTSAAEIYPAPRKSAKKHCVQVFRRHDAGRPVA